MFSSRFHWDFRANRLTQAIEARRREGGAILDLTESNPTRAGLNYPASIVRAFEDPRMLGYDPAPAGLKEAREAVAGYYAERGRRVDPDRILLTASTSEAYAYLFKLLCNPGDRILTPRPSYPLFEFLADMESVEVRQYPLRYDDGWCIDMEALGAAVTERTRAIVVVSPNNPTGSYVKRGEIEALARIAGNGLALISDEVFSDYGLNGAERQAELGEPAALVADCLSFSMSGLSKIAGLPQMKLGWILAGGPEELRREAMEKLEWIADTYLSVGTPVQRAAGTLLREGAAIRHQIRARTSANLGFARAALDASAGSILRVEGGWYIVIRVPRVRTEEEWALELLSRQGLLVQPGFFFDFESEAFLVVSLLTAEPIFREGIKRLRAML
jgi:alanine-synthesizing transaminase